MDPSVMKGAAYSRMTRIREEEQLAVTSLRAQGATLQMKLSEYQPPQRVAMHQLCQVSRGCSTRATYASQTPIEVKACLKDVLTLRLQQAVVEAVLHPVWCRKWEKVSRRARRCHALVQ